jgi:hypothetical protein
MYISDIHPDVVRRTVVTVLVIFEDRLSMAGVGWRGDPDMRDWRYEALGLDGSQGR